MRKVLMAMMMLALMAVLVACGGDTDKDKGKENDQNDTSGESAPTEDASNNVMEITHELAKEPVEVAKSPEKVVVFDFGMLDTFDELGIEVAGVPQKNIPSYLSKYEDEKYVNVGGLKEPGLEAIHAMQPDVIFISGRQSDMYDELSEIAPTIFVGLDTSNYMDSFKGNMALVAELFEKEDEMAAELADIDEKIAAIQEKTSGSDDKALIILANEGKISAYGEGSRFGIIHDVFGFQAADEKIAVSTHGNGVTFEYILETNPDAIFVIDRTAVVGGETSAKETVENDLVKKTAAFENDAIYYLDPNYWYLSGGGLLSIKEMIKEIEEAL